MTPRDAKPGPKPSPTPKSFVPPFELMGSRPRDVQLTATGRVVNGLAIALMAGAIVLTIVLGGVSAQQTRDRETFRREAVTTTAEVTRLWRDTNEDKQRWVAYRFETNGGSVAGRSKLGSSRWGGLRVGSPIDVRYLPASPEGSVLVGREPDVLPPVVPFLVGSLMIAVGLLMLRGLNSQRRLLAEGRAAGAVVTDVVKHQSSHGSHRSLKYTFRLLSGAMASGSADAPSKPPEVGGVICVVYDPDRPKRSRRYPFPLVKTARL